MARRKPTIPRELLDQLLDGSDPATVFESDGLVDELKRALAERILDAEMDAHLGSEVERAGRNHRNGHSKKTVLTDSSALELSIPRDRHGHFEPLLIEKYCRRFPGFDEKIIALYARGMSTRDIQAHVRDLYGLAISPDLVSAVTNSVLDEVKAWQSRPLDAVYPIVYLDAIHLKMRTEGRVQNQAVYLALGINLEGNKDLLGVGLNWGEPNPNQGAGSDSQYAAEVFYRVLIGKRVNLTADLQYIKDPAANPFESSIWVFGARGRVAF